MKIIVKKNLFISTVINTVSMIIFAIMYASDDSFKSTDSYFKLLSVVSMINIVISFLSNKANGIKLISAYSFILIFSYIYILGQIWLLALGIELTGENFIITRYNNELVNNAVLIQMVYLCAINLFVNIFFIKNVKIRKIIPRKEGVSTNNDSSLFYTGVIFFILFFVLLLYFDAMQIIAALATGQNAYAETYTMGRDFPLYYFASYTYPLPIFAIMFGTTKRHFFIKKIVIIYGLLRPLIMMLIVGSRAFYIPMIVCLFLYYVEYSTKKIDFFRLFMFGSVGILVYSFVAATRNTDINIGIIDYMQNHNFFVSFLKEMGATSMCMILLLQVCPNSIDFAMGKSYLVSALTLIPGGSLFRDLFFGDLINYLNLAEVLNNYFTSGSGLAGFYISEIYYNFSLIGIIFTPIIAYLFSRISAMCEFNSDKSSLSKAVSYYLFYIVLIYMRSEFYELLLGLKYLLEFYITYKLVQIVTERNVRSVKSRM